MLYDSHPYVEIKTNVDSFIRIGDYIKHPSGVEGTLQKKRACDSFVCGVNINCSYIWVLKTLDGEVYYFCCFNNEFGFPRVCPLYRDKSLKLKFIVAPNPATNNRIIVFMNNEEVKLITDYII